VEGCSFFPQVTQRSFIINGVVVEQCVCVCVEGGDGEATALMSSGYLALEQRLKKGKCQSNKPAQIW